MNFYKIIENLKKVNQTDLIERIGKNGTNTGKRTKAGIKKSKQF